MVLLRQNQLKIEGKTSNLDDTFFPSKFQKNCRGTVLLNGTITPSEELIDQFQEWNKTKTGEKRLVSYNRAKQWICRLLKKEVSIPQGHRMRQEDFQNALDHMITAHASGMTQG